MGADFEPVRELIRNTMSEQSVPSFAIAVALEGEIIWEEAFGWADREALIPATPDTMYSLASISKPFTATGIMILRDRGLIHLDKPINNYLGEAKLNARVGKAKDATVRRVANHTSGLPLHFQFFYEDEPYLRPPMDETILRYGNLVTAPGERSQYSNLGYGVLDYVIERLSGKSFADFMRQEVFVPLGMNRASINIGEGLDPYAATRYGPDGSRYPFYDFDHPGGSAVFCSAHDLARFGMLFVKEHLSDQKQILSDSTIDEMQVATASEGEGSYGIGWGINTNALGVGLKTASHSGGMGGVSTALITVPEERLVIAALCNAQTLLPHLVFPKIAVAALPSLAPKQKEIEDRFEKAMRGATDPQPPKPAKPGPDFVGEWKGFIHTYKTDVPISLSFKRSGEVHAQVADQPKTLLTDIAPSGNGRIMGRMVSDVGTEDANRRPYQLYLDLVAREDTLNGAAIALSVGGQRVGNALSHWVELKRRNTDKRPSSTKRNSQKKRPQTTRRG